jgi:hypothetical protein
MRDRDQDLELMRVLIREGTEAADREKIIEASDLWNRLKSTTAIENDPVLDELRGAINEAFKICPIRDSQIKAKSMIPLDANIHEAIVRELAAAQGQRPPQARASYDEARALLRACGVDASRSDIRLLLALGRDRAVDHGLTPPIVEVDAQPKEFYTAAEVLADIEATDRKAKDRDDWAKAQREGLELGRWADVDIEQLSELIRDTANARTPAEWALREHESIDFAARWHWNRPFSDEARRELMAWVRASDDLESHDDDDDELLHLGGVEGSSDRDQDLERLRVLIQRGTEAADRDSLIKASNVWYQRWKIAGANEDDPVLEPLREALNEGFKACDVRESQQPLKPPPEELISSELDGAMRRALIRELAGAQGELTKARPRSRVSYEEACGVLRAFGVEVNASDVRLLLAAGRHRALVDGVAGRDHSEPTYSTNEIRAHLDEIHNEREKAVAWALSQRQALAERRWADLDVNGSSTLLAEGLPPVLTREEQEEQLQDWINFVVSSKLDRITSKELRRQLSQGLRAFYGDDDGNDDVEAA